MELSKALVVPNYDLFNAKLKDYGFPLESPKYIKSYLTDRI